MQIANEVSLSPAQLSLKKPERIRHSPSYLYQKGTIYYFRYALSSEEKKRFHYSEIRISLRTGFVHEARKLARQLRAKLEDIIMSDQTEMSFAEVKAALHKQLEELMDMCPEKNPPSPAEIRQRMDGVRQRILDDADTSLYRPERGVLLKNGKFVQVPPAEYLEQAFQMFQKLGVNNPEPLLKTLYPDVIIELLKERIFSPEELTPESILQILNEYQKMQITLNRIMTAREKGDYGYERAFQPSVTHQVVEQKYIAPLSKSTSAALTVSDFIKKYSEIKIKDNEWRESDLATYQSRLDAFQELYGDRDITTITRDDMRDYRDILTKLPPNRKRSKLYKGKKIQQILEMDIKTTLNITTINNFIEIVSSMFDWGIQERLIDFNPAKGLQFKDEHQDIVKRESSTEEDVRYCRQIIFIQRQIHLICTATKKELAFLA